MSAVRGCDRCGTVFFERAAVTAVTRQDTDLWTLELELRDTEEGHTRGAGVPQAHLICARDRASVYCLSVDTRASMGVFTVDGLAAAVMRHVRESHCDGGGNLAG